MSSASGAFIDTLSAADKSIYAVKLNYIGGLDPYSIDNALFERDPELFPDVSYADIVNYLVFSPNPAYTPDQMKAFKGLDAHNQFTSGWVRDVMVHYPRNYEDTAVICGKVLPNWTMYIFMAKLWYFF